MNESLEKHVADEWERILGPHPHPGALGGWQMRAEAIVKERDALKAELATLRTGSAQLAADMGTALHEHRGDLIVELRQRLIVLESDMDACKRDRDAANRKLEDTNNQPKGASAWCTVFTNDIATLRQQLTEKSALCERLEHVLIEVSNVFTGWHSDGTAWGQYDQSVWDQVTKIHRELFELLQRAEGKQ